MDQCLQQEPHGQDLGKEDEEGADDGLHDGHGKMRAKKWKRTEIVPNALLRSRFDGKY